MGRKTEKTYETLSTGRRGEGDVTWEKVGHRMGHWGHLKVHYLLYKQQDAIVRCLMYDQPLHLGPMRHKYVLTTSKNWRQH